MPAKEVEGLSKKDVDKMLKQIKDIKDFLEALKELGAEIPKPLLTALDRLEMAIKAGKAVAEAADEAQEALDKYVENLNNACKNIDEAQQDVCEAGVARKWQARGVNFVLSPKNPDSVLSNTIRKAIQKVTPKAVCKHWEYCAKNAKD
jgi:hypothetical protein